MSVLNKINLKWLIVVLIILIGIWLGITKIAESNVLVDIINSKESKVTEVENIDMAEELLGASIPKMRFIQDGEENIIESLYDNNAIHIYNENGELLVWNNEKADNIFPSIEKSENKLDGQIHGAEDKDKGYELLYYENGKYSYGAIIVKDDYKDISIEEFENLSKHNNE